MPEPTCGCPRKCACETGILAAHTHHNLSKIIRFLTSLNDNFAMIRSQILIMQPLPKLNKKISLVIQHERQFPNEEKTLVDNVDTGRGQFKPRGGYSSGYNGRNGSKICTHCGKTGHTIETCYKKHGIPPHWQKTASNVTNDEVEETREEEESKNLGITKDQYDPSKFCHTSCCFIFKVSQYGEM